MRVGVDLGSTPARVVALGPGAGGMEVRIAEEIPVPLDLPGGEVGDAARELLRRLGGMVPLGSAVSLALPPHWTRLRRLALPRMDRAATLRALSADAVFRLPGVDPARHHYAFHETVTPDAAPGGTRHLLAVAAHRDLVAELSQAVEAAGFTLGRIAAAPVALADLHAAAHPEDASSGRRVLLVDLGEARTELLLLEGGVPVTTHQVLFGTGAGRDRAGAPPGAPGPSTVPLAVPDLAAEWAARLHPEIRMTLGASARELGAAVEPSALAAVRACGAAAGSGPLLDALASELGIAVAALDPAGAFPFPEGVDAHAFGRAVGVALGPAEGAVLPIDLRIPPEAGGRRGPRPREVARGLARDPVIVAGAAAALALGMAASWSARAELDARAAELAARGAVLAARADSLRVIRARTAALRAEQDRFAGVLGTVRALEAGRTAFPRLLDAAARALPEYAWLERVEMDPAPPGAAGAATRVSGFAPTMASVGGYERALQRSGLFERVALAASDGVEIGGVPLVRFTLAGTLRVGERGRAASAGYTAPASPPTPPAPGAGP